MYENDLRLLYMAFFCLSPTRRLTQIMSSGLTAELLKSCTVSGILKAKWTGIVCCLACCSCPSHITFQGPVGLFLGSCRAILNRNRASTHGTRTGPVRRRANFAVWGPSSFNACIISLRAAYSFKDRKQLVNSLCRDRKGSIRDPYGHKRCLYRIFTNSGWVNSLTHQRFPYGTRTTPVGHRTGSLWNPVNYLIKP